MTATRDTLAIPRGGNVAARSDHGGRGLHDRLGTYLWTVIGTLAGLHGAVLLVRVRFFDHGLSDVVLDGMGILHLVTFALLAGSALACRRRALSRRALATVDVMTPLLVAIINIVPIATTSHSQRIGIMALMTIAIVLLLRAALVPSTWQRTLFVGLATIGPMVTAVATNVSLDAMILGVPLREVMLTLCCAISLAILLTTALTSAVIFRLHRELKRARQLGPYQIGRRLGEGGMGAVYEARHVLMPRPVALKLVRPELRSNGLLNRFEEEARVTGCLSHPNIVALYEYGETVGGMPYFVMELVDGRPLDRVLTSEGPLPARRAFHILRQLAAGLAHAHAREWIHGDIKPGNIMLAQREGHRDLVKILDFGLSRKVGRREKGGSVRGTPLFMAPEVILGSSALGPEVDIYAFGVVAYALLTGKHLFAEHEKRHFRLLQAHVCQPVLPASLLCVQPVAADLENVVLRCLEKDPKNRFATGGELYAALMACDEPEATDAPRPADVGRCSPFSTTAPLALVVRATPHRGSDHEGAASFGDAPNMTR